MVSALKIEELKSEESCIRRTGEKLSLSQSLTDAFGLKGMLIDRMTLPPGRRASAPHFHSTKEEIIIVESGKPSAWLDGKLIELSPGECIGFRPGEPAHMIVNRSTEAAVFYTIGTNPPDDEVTYVKDCTD